MIEPNIFEAVRLLVGGNLSSHGTFESIVYHDNQTPPTKKQAEDKLVELQTEWDSQEYARKREAEYPSIQECIHAILDDDLDALQVKRADIKKKYPKG